MNLYCIKCSKLTKSYNIEIKRKIDGKVILYRGWIDCGFKTIEIIDKEEISDLLKF